MDNKIKRYYLRELAHISTSIMDERDTGDYVTYEDHVATVSELEKANNELREKYDDLRLRYDAVQNFNIEVGRMWREQKDSHASLRSSHAELQSKITVLKDLLKLTLVSLSLAKLKIGHEVAHPQSVWFEVHILEKQRQVLETISRKLKEMNLG